MAVSMGILFLTLSKRIEKLKAAAVVLSLAFSYSVWHFAVDGRAVGFSVIFSILMIQFLFDFNNQKEITRNHIIIAAGFSSLIAFAHGIGIFHVIPIFWWLMHKDKKYACSYLILTGGIILATYVTVFHLFVRPEHPIPFLSWAMGYAGFGGTSEIFQSTFWIKDYGQLLSGLWKGWNYSFFKPILTGHGSEELISILFGGIALAALVGGIKKYMSSPHCLPAILLGWGGIVTLFLAFWSPGQEGFRLHVIIPWAVALALIFKDSKYYFKCLALFTALIFTSNISGPIYHAASIQNNTGYQMLLTLQTLIKPGDTFISARGGFIPDIEVLRPYFFPRIKGGTIQGRLMAFRETSLSPLKQRLQELQAEGHSIYMASDVFNKDIQTQIEKEQGLKEGEFIKFLENMFPQETHELNNEKQFFRVDLRS